MKKLIVLCVLLELSLSVFAGIMIYPKFLFFDDKTKVGEISLVNSNSIESSNYRITLSYKKQNLDGTYTEIKIDEGQKAPLDSAVPLLRYSPRSTLLGPSQTQTVRVLKRLPEGLESGDYVAYITFTEVLMEKPLNKQQKDNTFSVQITPIPSFSIPIVVRYKNKENAKVSLQVLNKKDKDIKPSIIVQIKKDKKMLVRGDISVWLKDEMIGLIRGKYLLPSTDSIQVPITLQREKENLTWEKLKGKEIKVLYTEYDENKLSTKDVLAKTAIKL